MRKCVVWIGGRERKIFGGAQAFSTRAHLKLVSPKWRENSVGGVL